MYGVGVWPQSPNSTATDPGTGVTQDGYFGWSENALGNPENRISLNVGTDKETLPSNSLERWYMKDGSFHPHGARGRKWGPSSAHPGIVIHLFGDDHVKPIDEDIDRNSYLRLITRAGSEPVDESGF